MIKTEKHLTTFSGGIDQDTSVNKYGNSFYFDAENMRIISNDSLSSGALTNVKGNQLRFTFAVGDTIIGYCKIRSNVDTTKDAIVFFACNNATPKSKIYLFEGDPFLVEEEVDMDAALASHTYSGYAYKSGLLYYNDDLNFNINYPIKAEGRYESTNIRKVYWVDGLNNIRYMAIDTVNIADPITKFDINPTAALTQPIASVVSGGKYTSGLIQYGYQLYIKNGAATTYSAPSEILYLTGGDGSINSKSFSGTNLGENTGKAVEVTINNLDTNYNRIRIIAIHYTEYLVNPTINIIGEYEYAETTLTITDNGYTVYGTVPIEEYRLFGQTNYIANSLASKNNYLFFADIIEDKWNPSWLDHTDVNFWDSRAIRYRDQAVLSHTDSTAETNPFCNFGTINMVRDTDATFITTITGFSTILGIDVARTVTNITNIVFNNPVGDCVSGEWDDGIGGTTLFSSTPVTTTINNILYVPGTDTLTFSTTTSGAPYFGVGYNHINSLQLFNVIYTYTYTQLHVYEDSVVYDNGTPITITVPTDTADPAEWDIAGWDDYVYNHDGLNNFNDTDNDADLSVEFKYQSDLSTLGAEGPNVLIEFTTEDLYIDTEFPGPSSDNAQYSSIPSSLYDTSPINSTHRSSQRREVYRTYIVFYNTKMQYSHPQWICDLRMPSNDEYLTVVTDITGSRFGKYLYPKVTLRSIPTDTNLYGWQIFRCERGSSDRSVLASGVISACHQETIDGINDLLRPYSNDVDYPYALVTAEDIPADVNKSVLEMISPEISFNKNLNYVSGDKLRVEGRMLVHGWNHYVLAGNNDRIITLSLGASYATHSTDVLNYNLIDGGLQSPGIVHGDPIQYPASQLFGGDEFKNILRFDSAGTHYYGSRGTNFIAVTADDVYVSATNHGIIYASYVRNVFNIQYGGNTYEARSYNSVVPYSQFNKIAVTNTTCYNGDTHITPFAYLRSSIPDITYGGGVIFQQEMIYLPVESSINCFYRNDKIQKYYSPDSLTFKIQETIEEGLLVQPTEYPVELGSLYRYNSIYSKSGSANLIQNTLFDSSNIEHSDVKIIATGKKINNEYFDSWTNLYTNNNIELDPKFGPIRNIFNFNNKLFTGQDKGIAVISVNDRSIIQDNNKLQLTLGTGGVLERFDYLTVASGFQNYYDMILSDKAFYYLDRRNKIIYNLAGEGDIPVSEIKGYRSFLKSYGTITTVKTGYDPIFKEVLFYISDGTIHKTSVFNEYTTSFTGKYGFEPDIMISLNDQLYSIVDETCYLHNYGNYGEFYGSIYDSTFTGIINPNENIINIFDILEARVDVIDTDGVTYLEKEQFDHMILNTNYQTITKSLHFSGDDSTEDTSKSVTRKWRTWLLPDDNSSDTFFRLVDSYYKVKLLRHNIGNKKIVLHDLITLYRITKS